MSEKNEKNFYKNNVVGQLPRSGRPQKLSYRYENWIFRQIREDPKISNGGLAAELSSRENSVNISRDIS